MNTEIDLSFVKPSTSIYIWDCAEQLHRWDYIPWLLLRAAVLSAAFEEEDEDSRTADTLLPPLCNSNWGPPFFQLLSSLLVKFEKDIRLLSSRSASSASDAVVVVVDAVSCQSFAVEEGKEQPEFRLFRPNFSNFLIPFGDSLLMMMIGGCIFSAQPHFLRERAAVVVPNDEEDACGDNETSSAGTAWEAIGLA